MERYSQPKQKIELLNLVNNYIYNYNKNNKNTPIDFSFKQVIFKEEIIESKISYKRINALNHKNYKSPPTLSIRC